MPVYAHYVVDSLGKPTFTGHEMKVDPISGEVKFGTEPIGVHTAVEIKEDSVDVNGVMMTLPCLFADQKIWTRNKNAVAATRRLYEEGRLHNSWEVCSQEYTFADGIKTLTKYYFEGNTYLGTSAPAYGPSAKVLSLSSLGDGQLMVAEALALDMVERESVSKEEVDMEKENMIADAVQTEEIEGIEAAESTKEQPKKKEEEAPAPAPEPPEEDSKDGEDEKKDDDEAPEKEKEEEEEEASAETAEKEVDVSALTIEDIHDHIYRALSEDRDHGPRLYPAYIFPEEHEIWAHCPCANATEMVRIFYSIENNAIVLGKREPVVLTVSPRDMNQYIDNLKTDVVNRDEQIAQAAQKVSELNEQIEELSVYKKKFEEEQASLKRAELKEMCEKTKLFSSSELAKGEIHDYIEAMDEAKLKGIIADRFVCGLTKSSNVKDLEVHSSTLDISSISVENSVAEFRRTFLRK